VKKIIFAIMAVMVATPCLAQEIEPEGMLSIEGTRWIMIPSQGFGSYYVGFYQRKAYFLSDNGATVSCSISTESFYVDLLVVSLFIDNTSNELVYYGILQPMGFGILIFYDKPPNPFLGFVVLIKVDNNWKPPPECE
jgi:hypothetical protein